ncbi:poly(A) polymerase I precursor [bacterium BMS3Bbin12]|nr:poly(A) polymerase I precursor [bacterium BMS3Bbin12]GBE51541.1 poly(A) polymerase I precursor [bacterium BMS3Bbin13]
MDGSSDFTLTSGKPGENSARPRTLPRAEHVVSRSDISPNAIKVLYRLSRAGYRACLVGGGVRDLLLGREPKDFDVGTDARPEQVRALFRNCRLIGRRFRLAHVHFGREIIEVATFRGGGEAGGEGDDRQIGDNVYGTLEEDVWRRDFTVNALYYDIEDFSVVDYVGGVEDLQAGLLRVIGEPATRYREDPVRMLRAVRFAAKLGFRLEPDTEHPIPVLAGLLEDIPPARLFEEVLKLFLAGCALETFERLRHYGLFARLFPQTEACLAREEGGFPSIFVSRALANTDERVAAGKPVTPVFLFAALLWEPVRRRAAQLEAEGATALEAVQDAGDEVVRRQIRHVALPRRITLPMREIWQLQIRFAGPPRGKRALRLLQHPRFRAAYDLLALRAQAGEEVGSLVDWWTEFQERPRDEAPASSREQDGTSLREEVEGAPEPTRRRRRRRPRRRGARRVDGSAAEAPPAPGAGEASGPDAE